MDIKKLVIKEKRLWFSFDLSIFYINIRINNYYNRLNLEDIISKRNLFKELHYLKMLKQYIFLKMYHDKIKKTLSNEKLINYFETTLKQNKINYNKYLT